MEQLFIAGRIAAPSSVPDRAMEVFRRFSNFSPLACFVTRDGREMRYRIMRPSKSREFEKRCEQYMKHARLVISVFHLPLTPSIDEFRIGQVIIEASLILKYDHDADSLG